MDNSNDKSYNNFYSPFFEFYDNFSNELYTLEELNQHLPIAIEQIVDQQRQTYLPQIDEKIEKELSLLEEEFSKAIANDPANNEYNEQTESLMNDISRQAIEIFFQTRARKTQALSSNLNTLVRNMSLVFLIAKFEIFLGDILRVTFNIRPEILMTKEKSITYEELMKSSDLKTVIESIIEKEIASLFMEDIERIHEYFEKRLGMPIKEFIDWNQFTERFYRRNIIMHNNGRVNEIYIKKTGYDDSADTLDVDKEYLNESLSMFKETSYQITRFLHEKLL